jgi:hypothetical protein
LPWWGSKVLGQACSLVTDKIETTLFVDAMIGGVGWHGTVIPGLTISLHSSLLDSLLTSEILPSDDRNPLDDHESSSRELDGSFQL